MNKKSTILILLSFMFLSGAFANLEGVPGNYKMSDLQTGDTLSIIGVSNYFYQTKASGIFYQGHSAGMLALHTDPDLIPDDSFGHKNQGAVEVDKTMLEGLDATKLIKFDDPRILTIQSVTLIPKKYDDGVVGKEFWITVKDNHGQILGLHLPTYPPTSSLGISDKVLKNENVSAVFNAAFGSGLNLSFSSKSINAVSANTLPTARHGGPAGGVDKSDIGAKLTHAPTTDELNKEE